MNCWQCGTELIWGGDEDCGLDLPVHPESLKDRLAAPELLAAIKQREVVLVPPGPVQVLVHLRHVAHVVTFVPLDAVEDIRVITLQGL